MKFKFCPLCGSKLVSKDIGDEVDLPYCENCLRPYFDWFGQTVLVVVMNQRSEVLLLKQNYVSTTDWVLIAGYMKQGSTAEETVIREVFEETGQTAEELQYIKSYYYKKRELLMSGFLVHVNAQDFNNSSEVDEIKWFKVEDALTKLREGSTGKEHLRNCLELTVR